MSLAIIKGSLINKLFVFKKREKVEKSRNHHGLATFWTHKLLFGFYAFT